MMAQILTPMPTSSVRNITHSKHLSNNAEETHETIIIPVANPNTIDSLFTVAEKLINHRTGRIILLYVITDDMPVYDEQLLVFEEMIEAHQIQQSSCVVDFMTYQADTVADGILDIAQDTDAQMILIGLTYSVRGQVELGRIVETVTERAQCDVGVYRSPSHAYIDRVVIPVGGSIASRVILNIGSQLAQGYDFPCEALHVYSGTSEGEARGHVETLLTTIPNSDTININLLQGINAADSVLSWVTTNDMLVIGFSERGALEKWLYGNTAQRILDRARGPVLMVARAIDDRKVQARAKQPLSWLRPLLSKKEQEHVIWMAKDTTMPTLDYFILLIIAALLASFGLLLSSSAVVIGAMLVAPLMQPIIALGVGLCTARFGLMRRASVTILLSVIVAVGVGFLSGIIIAPEQATDEMLARAYPSLLDAFVAIASGFIGAYATARKDIPAALAGVAIAAALVPPICTAGLSLALMEPRLALGAGLLFIANLVSITVVGAIVFFWMGMRPTRLNNTVRRYRYMGVVASIILLLVIVGGLLNFSHLPSVERISETQLQAIFDPAEVQDLQIIRDTNDDSLEVVATIRTIDDIPEDSIRMAQVMLSEDLASDVRLRVVVQRMVLVNFSGETDNQDE